jgi:hypothetical protein
MPQGLVLVMVRSMGCLRASERQRRTHGLISEKGRNAQMPHIPTCTPCAGRILLTVLRKPQRRRRRQLRRLVTNAMQSGDTALAGHAVIDAATPLHDGQVWEGPHLDTKTVEHVLGDIFPSPGTIKQAYENEKAVLQGTNPLAPTPAPPTPPSTPPPPPPPPQPEPPKKTAD